MGRDRPLTKGRIIATGFSFNAAYLMVAFLVPLYAHHAGYSVVAIGALAAVPSMLQLPLRAVSGPLTDVCGEAPLLRVCFVAAALAGLLLAARTPDTTALVAAQLSMGLARGLYWVPIQAYLWQLPGDRADALGQLTSSNNGGSFLGILAAGPLAATLGFRTAFAVAAALAAICFMLALGLPRARRSGAAPTLAEAFRVIPRVLRNRLIWLCGGVMFLGAIPQALVQSFYPVYVVHLGHGEAVASAVTSLRSLGMIGAGLVMGSLFRRLGHVRLFTAAGALLGLALALTAWGSHLAAVVIGVAAAGVASGLLGTLGILTVAESSAKEERGTTIALVNMFFAGSMLVVPPLFGLLADRTSLETTFVLFGAAVLVAAGWLRRSWKRSDGAAGQTDGSAGQGAEAASR